MNKSDVVWLNEVSQILLSDSGYKLLFTVDHFNNHQWYEIQTPDNAILDYSTHDIYAAIDKINDLITTDPRFVLRGE